MKARPGPKWVLRKSASCLALQKEKFRAINMLMTLEPHSQDFPKKSSEAESPGIRMLPESWK